MKEVISIPAAKTLDIIKKYLIHAHPHPRKYKESQYVAFRKTGGVMDTLYSVQQELVIKPEAQNTEEQLIDLDSDIKERVLGYIHERKHTFRFGEKEEYKFYILIKEQDLQHMPRPIEGNRQSHTYYSFEEITSGKSKIMRESAINK
ncbi:hypothetical protein [Paenisporosarcina sp. OV554]|uniref:hypothetical protein n=1 Tax=Paenisporosarcina sp. OV554 TaxID=2135694 RepID=UPI000D3ADB1A|nr:hypothetical protein [Paenisporosarcina sp. OV554]PUB09926.1 hypothetical protein C8K15_12330 [Paenisporosarcina sp. OV554]